MRAMSGEITIVGPLLSTAGSWKHNDLPEPVARTPSTSRPASIAEMIAA